MEESFNKKIKIIRKTHREEVVKLQEKLKGLTEEQQTQKKSAQEAIEVLKKRIQILEKELQSLTKYRKILDLVQKYPQEMEALLKAKRAEMEQMEAIANRRKKLQDKGFNFLRTQLYKCNGQRFEVEEYFHPKSGLEFVMVPSGEYLLAGKPITLKSFLISKTEVTQKIWKNIMVTPSWKKQKFVRSGPDYPAVYLSWAEAKEFCKRTDLRLPTNIEWEVACRAGTTSNYYWGDKIDESYVWYKGNTEAQKAPYAHKVATKWANAYGLYDMSGNVWEWCEDQIKKGDTLLSVCRGGSWGMKEEECTSGSGRAIPPDVRLSELGFRPAFSVPE